MRSIVAIIAALLLFNCTFANSSYREHEMSKPGFSEIQKKVEEIANHKQLHNIQIDWAIRNNENFVATVSKQGHVKEIIFTKDEVAHIAKEGFTEKSIHKINSALDFFSNTREPSPRKPHP